MIYQQLFAQVKEPQTVVAGVIGCGAFGSTIVSQGSCVPRLEIPVVADINIDAAWRAFRLAGVADESISVCDSRAAALRAIESGRHVIVQDGMILMDLPLQVIVSSTRSPEAGTRYAYEAIRHGKHVVMVDKEADTVIGAILKHQADREGVVFTTDDGDEPGLLMGLVGWARSLGLEVLCGGNMHSVPYDPTTATVQSRGVTVRVAEADRWALARIPAGEALRYADRRRQLFADFRPDEETGDPMAHMAVAANGTGLLPDVPEGHRPVVRFRELPEVLCPAEDGGILRRRGAIDIPAILHTADEPTGGGGVFAVVSCDNKHALSVMIGKGLLPNSRKTAALVYRPHHLCGAETAMSVMCAGLLRVPTGSTTILPRVDILTKAARDFAAGEVIGSPGRTGHWRDLRASLVPAFRVGPGKPVPFYMLEGNRLKRDVPAGTTFTWEAIETPTDSLMWFLRQQQDEMFLSDGALNQ